MGTAYDTFLNAQIRKCTSMPDVTIDVEINVGSYLIRPMRTLGRTINCDYLEGMFEEHFITVFVDPIQYQNAILVGHEDLIVKLVERAKGSNKRRIKRYRGVLLEVKDEVIEAEKKGGTDPYAASNMSVAMITLQLVDIPSYDLRLRQVKGDTFLNATAAETLTYYLVKNKLSDTYSNSESVARVSVDDVQSKKRYRNLKVKEGLELMELPDYLQDNYGIFGQGIGCYFQDQTWHVFAPYNLAKANKDVPRLVILITASDRHRTMETTFNIQDNVYTIIATGDVTHNKQSDAEAMNEGTGIRFAAISDPLDQASSTDGTSDSQRRAKDYMTDYRSSNYKSPYQYTKTASERFSDNPLKFQSELAARGGDTVQVTWESAASDIFVPAMPVTLYYERDGAVEKRQGTLTASQVVQNFPDGSASGNPLITTAVLNLWLKNT